MVNPRDLAGNAGEEEDVLSVICTLLHTDHLRIHAGDSLQRRKEIVKKWGIAPSELLLLLLLLSSSAAAAAALRLFFFNTIIFVVSTTIINIISGSSSNLLVV